MKKLFASLLLVLLAPTVLASGLVLREDTASQAVMVGPYVDSDGAPLTGLTINASDIRVSKNGANMVSKNSGGCTHDEIGFYTCTFDATDTDTAGRLQIMSAVSGALVVKMDFQVLPTAVYDRDNASGAVGYIANAPVNVAQVSGDSTAADTLETWLDGTAGPAQPLGIARQGTAQSATSTTIVLDAGASFADSTIVGMTVMACGSTQGYCQSRAVTANVGSTDTATVGAWNVTPSGTITYYLFSTAPGAGGSGATAAEVWAYSDRQLTALDEDVTAMDLNGTATGAAASVTGAVGSVAGNVGGNLIGSAGSVVGAVGSVAGNVSGNVVGSVGSVTGAVASVTGAVGSVTGAVGSVTGNVGGNLAGNVLGTVATVNALAANSVNASAVATDAVTEIQSGLATASALTTVGSNVTSVKTKTDSLTFTKAGEVDSNVQSMNGATLLGDGTTGDKWRGQ